MAYVDSLVWLRRDELPESRWKQIESDLLIVPRPRRTVALEGDTEDGTARNVWRTEAGEPVQTLVQKDGLYGVPIEYGYEKIRGLDIEDRTVMGDLVWKPKRLPDMGHANAPPGQGEFADNVLGEVTLTAASLACAPTGSGKTVVSLRTAGMLGVPTLVVVPSGVLADQWRDEAIKHLGISRRMIGTVGGSRELWRGKWIVIVIIHNLYMKTYCEEFYKYFGMVIWDEAHKLGAPMFAKSLQQFPSRYKLAVTATPGRKDGLDKLLWNYFGKPSATASAPALATTCWEVKNPLCGNIEWIQRCRNDVRPLKWLAGLEGRNKMLANLIVGLWERGYSVIAMSKFTNHVEEIIRLLIAAGIPTSDVGQFTRTQGKKSTRVGQGYLSSKRECRVLVGTYAMLKEGFDDPKRDAGVELLPVADNVQGIGRVRRPFAGKRKPVWFTISDLNVPLFERYTNSRLQGFKRANVTLKILKEGSL